MCLEESAEKKPNGKKVVFRNFSEAKQSDNLNVEILTWNLILVFQAHKISSFLWISWQSKNINNEICLNPSSFQHVYTPNNILTTERAIMVLFQDIVDYYLFFNQANYCCNQCLSRWNKYEGNKNISCLSIWSETEALAILLGL